jgi:hypothetical protein
LADRTSRARECGGRASRLKARLVQSEIVDTPAAAMRYTRTEDPKFRPRLNVGDHINLTYGRILFAQGPLHHRHFYRELLFEVVRNYEFPDRPSRLTSTFAWVGDPAWIDPDPNDYIYEVTFDSAGSFVADPSFLASVETVLFADLVERARSYWRGDGDVCEVVVPGLLTVAAVIQ